MSVRELNAEVLFEILKKALSGSEEERGHAEKQIAELEDHSGFFASLAEISLARDTVQSEIRWLAMVCLKNAVPRCWRVRNKDTLTEEERDYVRKSILQLVGEPDQRVSVAIGRIARLNCPEEWPELIPNLIGTIMNSTKDVSKQVVDHALETMYIVLKEFKTRRLRKDRLLYESMAPELLRSLLPIWELCVSSIVNDSSTWEHSMHTAKLVMKSIRQLLAHGLHSVEGNEQAHAFFARILQLPALFFRGTEGGSDEEMALSKLAVKSAIDAQNRHPTGFRQFLAPFLEGYTSMLLTYDPNRSSGKILALGCKFVRNVAQCPTYRRPVGSVAEADFTPAAEACKIVETFFSVERCSALIKELIGRIFVLTEAEILTWDEDPESLVREEEAAEWSGDKLRPIAESLYGSLLSRHRDYLVSAVLAFTENVPESELLLRDACYRAIGSRYYEFKLALNFSAWFHSQLEPYLKADVDKDMRGRVAKARAAWLVGQFVSQIPQESRAPIYNSLVPLLTNSSDLVVSLTAVMALNSLVEDPEFDGACYSPYLVQTLSGIFHLASVTHETESLTRLLQFATTLIEGSPPEVVLPHVGTLAKQLMVLWDSGASSHNSADDIGALNHIRGSLVGLLRRIIEVVGSEVVKNEDILKLYYPVIFYGTSLEGDGAVYLAEDALALWLVLLHELDSYSEEMSNLFVNLVGILQSDFDNLKVSLDIIVAYAAVGRAAFMQTHGPAVVQIFDAITGNVKDRGAVAAADAMEVILQLFPQEAPRVLVPVLSKMLALSMSEKESVLVTKSYENLLARVAVQDYDSFVMILMSETGGQQRDPREKLLFVMRDMIDKVKTVAFKKSFGQADMHWKTIRKKTTAMALCVILTKNAADPEVMTEMPLVLNVMVQVLAEIEDESKKEVTPLTSHDRNLVTFAEVAGDDEFYRPGNNGEYRKPTKYQEMMAQLADQDMIASLNFKEVCRSAVDHIRNINPSGFQKAVATSAPSLLSQLDEKIG